MKIFLTFLILLFTAFSSFPSFALTLSGNASYDVDSAREEAFNNLEYSFSPDLIMSHLVDNDSAANQNALLNGNVSYKDRILCKFSNGIYGIRYKDDPYRAYYYTPNGKLSYVDKKDKLSFPHKVSTYDLKGALIGTALYITDTEQYIFDLNKTLTTHWVGNDGFDKNGIKKWSRTYTR